MNIVSFKPIAGGHYFGEARSSRNRPYRFGVTPAGEVDWVQRGEIGIHPDGWRLWLQEVKPPEALTTAVRNRLKTSQKQI